MRSTLVRLIFCFTAVTVAVVVRGGTVLEASYNVAVSGANSDGSRIPVVRREVRPTDPLQDPSAIEFGDTLEASTDVGFGTVNFAAFATHQDMKKLLGAQISGGASIVRIPFISAGGSMDVSGSLRIAYHDAITLQISGPLPAERTLLEGFLKLHGSVDANSTKTGSSDIVQGSATARVLIDGTGLGLNSNFRQVFQTAGEPKNSLGLENINVIPFSYFVTPGDPMGLEYTMSVTGIATTSSALFTDPVAGTAASTFNANFENTLEWGGITSVTRASTGEPITDWSVTSESGFDYSQVFPIPEPSVLILLFTAAATLALRRRRLNRNK